MWVRARFARYFWTANESESQLEIDFLVVENRAFIVKVLNDFKINIL
jgi:hypothetical protein